MALKLAGLYAALATLRGEADGICAAAVAEQDRDLTAAENDRLGAIKAEIVTIDAEMATEIAALEAAEAAKTVPPAATPEALATAAERKRAADIVAACGMVGKPDRAAAFLADGKALDEVVATLQAERAAASPHITTSNPGHPGTASAPSWDKAIAKANDRIS